MLDHPEVERELWQKLSQFEAETALVPEGLDATEVTDYLSPEAFFSNRPEVPHVSGTALANVFKNHGAVSHSHELGWCIPAWSALMYTHRLSDFIPLRNLGGQVRGSGVSAFRLNKQCVGARDRRGIGVGWVHAASLVGSPTLMTVAVIVVLVCSRLVSDM